MTKFGLDCPCFVTTPCHDMGAQLMKDLVKSKLFQSEWTELSLNDIDVAFQKMNRLRYSQPFTLSGIRLLIQGNVPE